MKKIGKFCILVGIIFLLLSAILLIKDVTATAERGFYLKIPSYESEHDLHPVYRVGEKTVDRIVQELLSLKLSSQEQEMGLFSPFLGRCQDFRLRNFEVVNKTLFLEFEDPNFWSSGGSHRVLIMRDIITETLLQLEEVEEVIFVGEALQP